jgi:hypothetical protein
MQLITKLAGHDVINCEVRYIMQKYLQNNFLTAQPIFTAN